MDERIAGNPIPHRLWEQIVVVVTAGDIHADLNIARDRISLTRRTGGRSDRVVRRSQDHHTVQLRVLIHGDAVGRRRCAKGSRLESKVPIDIGADPIGNHLIAH